MKAPEFWLSGGPLSALLAPLGWVWGAGAVLRQSFAREPAKAPLPVICVGNLVAGGAGKTPVALSLAERLPGAHFLSRGYGGSNKGPVLVDPRHHTHRLVGDEALLLAEMAPCWVARDRVAGALAAAESHARCLIMDDGFQYPALLKDLALLVVDGAVGFGSNRCIPAGPLREPVAQGLKRADAVVLLGEDRHGVARQCRGLPILRAHLEPEAEAQSLAGERVIAFAGIGRPMKFFNTLKKLGARVVHAYAFPDHHPYHPNEIAELLTVAKTNGAALITTTKDMVRISPHQRDQLGVLRVTVTWHDDDAVTRLIHQTIPALDEAPR